MTGFPASCADFHKTLCFNVFGSLLVMCIRRNFLSVGVSVREGYWRIKLSLPSLLIASVTFLLCIATVFNFLSLLDDGVCWLKNSKLMPPNLIPLTLSLTRFSCELLLV